MPFTGREIEVLKWLLKKERQLDQFGRCMDRFSDRTVGRRLFRKIPPEWREQTGWYLSGAICYRLTKAGRRAIRTVGQPSQVRE
jgi:hypothetical protein